MLTKPRATGKTGSSYTQKNTVETLTDLGSSVVKGTADTFGQIGSGIFDQFLGGYDDDYTAPEYGQGRHEQSEQKPKKKEGNLFSYNAYHEKEVVSREIRKLTEEIKQAVKMLKSEASDLVKDAEKLSIEPISEKPGIYHTRLLEVILSFLKTLRAKVGESKTWMQALISKKKKRGSLFAALSKKKGTQYSMSQELQNSRSVQ
jgi:hypothetical protein